MSSSGASDYLPGKKLVVHVAENGRSFEFECDGLTPVEVVQRSIESLSGIACNDQLLLCLEKRLEPHRNLSFYKLPQDDREVFLYNRPRLHADSLPPDLEIVEVPDNAEPPPPSPNKNPHLLDDAPDPALKALPSYERRFRYHFQRGRAVYTSTQMKFEMCQRLASEQRVQERALDTARASMDQGYHIVHQSFSEFSKCYSHQHRCHSEILANLGKDIERLRSCDLHPLLQTETRKCLLDLVKEDNLRKWAENCANSHRQFEVKVSQLKSMFAELKKRVEDLTSDKASSSIRNLELMIRDHEKYLNEQKSIMQSLSKDVNTVKKLIDECLSSQLSASLRPHDAVSALGPMYDVHEKSHLPKMQGCDRAMMKLLDLCKTKKNEMNFFVHNFMQRVVYAQSIIRDIRMQFPAFKEAMERQNDFFANLKLVRGIAPAYRACFAEVIRRKSSMKLYMGLAGQLAEKLATERENEIRKREEFLKVQSVYVPRDMLSSMGLFDSPKQCDVNVAPFDADLLDIDFVDLDHYAPNHLTGIPPRNEKNLVPKVGMAASQENYDFSEAEANSAVTNERCDSSELQEGCESVEIAGTSKMEVENAWLKAELASALAMICSLSPETAYESVDDSKLESVLKSTAEKTAEALHLKDEYSKHLQSMLKMKEMQCAAYEKRIQELEQGLADQYLQGQKLSTSRDASESSLSALKADGEVHAHYLSSEPMDEASSCSALLEPKLEQFSGALNKVREGVDENMADSSSNVNVPAVDLGRTFMDSSMLESLREEHESGNLSGQEKLATEFGLPFQNDEADDNDGYVSSQPCESASPGSDSNSNDDIILELRNTLAEKTNECQETELKLKAVMEEAIVLRRELEVSRKLLDESQMNCAHLENCLHEAREEAHTNLCAADRRASEYTALRASAVKMHTLFERFRNCVTSSVSVANFAESLRSLALSLTSSAKEDEDSVAVEFRSTIKMLADKVGFLSRQRAELLDRCTRAEAGHGVLAKEAEEKKELVKNLYTKLQVEKQASKEKISFGRLDIQELAAFVLNSHGYYEAINHNFVNYYLSSESIALFVENLPVKPTYIVGQVVHIERQIVRPSLVSSPGSGKSPNPYNLPVGCEYFVVTVAMLPDTIHSLSS